MRFRTQAVAYPYFVVALLLYGLQMAFGLLSAAKYLGPDPIKDFLPFDVSKAIHTNLLIVWILTGFMGAAYWLVPEESRTELHSPKLAYWALGPVDARRRDRGGGVPVRLDGGEQAPRAAAARQARDRGRDADVSLQPRHDDLEGEAADDDGRHPDGRARADRHAVSAVAVRVRQLHHRHLLPVVDGAPVGRGRMGDDPGRAARLPADPPLGHRSRGDGEVAVRHRRR